jgi:hypothetical protein
MMSMGEIGDQERMDFYLENLVVGHGCVFANALHRCSRLVGNTFGDGSPGGVVVLVVGRSECSRVLPPPAWWRYHEYKDKQDALSTTFCSLRRTQHLVCSSVTPKKNKEAMIWAAQTLNFKLKF